MRGRVILSGVELILLLVRVVELVPSMCSSLFGRECEFSASPAVFRCLIVVPSLLLNN